LARKILLADDSVTAQNMGRKILADAGYEVITVNNGSAALKKIAEQKPDLIVLDVYMPGYSGLEVCQRLKETGETSRVPVLLTVGKLEPFKPEEAKRVRADAFIVKPFEASELLSALSKLEDKIVPRAEASKPGRFARATQAIEEGRYDKSVAVDEDSGWRNRIAFPSKKKEKEKAAQEQENGDEAGIYNAMNKDLRTVVEHKLAEHPQEAKAEEERVDLGALAPEGLPKDVTPEEIAALAAAAAQVKGKIAESHSAEPVAEAKAEHKTEVKEQAQAQTPQEVPEVVPQAATFAEQKPEEKSEEKVENKTDASAEKSSDAVQEPASIPTPSSSDVMAAIAGLESDAAQSANSGNGSWSNSTASHTADEPITMAAAAGAGNGAATSRWTAVSVALAPEEAAISLEQEMRQAYAAFAAAETAYGPAVSSESQTSSAAPAAVTETSSLVEEATPDSVAAVPASPAPEAAQALSAVASAATEAISAAVQELEAVAASYVAEKPKSEPELVGAESATSASPEAPKAEAAHLDVPEVAPAEPAQKSAQGNDEPSAEAPVPVAAAEPEPATIADSPVPVPAQEGSVQESSADQPREDSVPKSAASGPDQPAAEGTSQLSQPESDVAETTAAAWANWRRIRESGDSKTAPAEPSEQEKEAIAAGVQEAAAMAVAAGAEKHSDEPAAVPESDADGIASIVDSVLADLRPKIVEEISRKMGKKK
jgi:twitching motility two-component system response regulator PilH